MGIYVKMKLTIGILYFLQTLTCIQGYGYNYIGCFKDRKGPNRALPVNHKSYFGNKAEYCVDRCGDEGYRYFGLAEGFECWCGNSGYDRYGKSQHCYYPCTGNFSQICGARHRNSVYKVVYPTTTSKAPNLNTTTTRTLTNQCIISSHDSTSIAIPKQTSTSNLSTPESSKLENGSTSPAFRNQSGTSVGIGIAVGAVVVGVAIVLALEACTCSRKVARYVACKEESHESPSIPKHCLEPVKPAAARTGTVRRDNVVYNACRYTVLPQRPKHVTDNNAKCSVLATSNDL